MSFCRTHRSTSSHLDFETEFGEELPKTSTTTSTITIPNHPDNSNRPGGSTLATNLNSNEKSFPGTDSTTVVTTSGVSTNIPQANPSTDPMNAAPRAPRSTNKAVSSNLDFETIYDTNGPTAPVATSSNTSTSSTVIPATATEPNDTSKMDKPEATPATDVKPEEEPGSPEEKPPIDTSEMEKLEPTPATDVKSEGEPGLQMPNDTSEMKKPESPPEPTPPTDVKPEEKPDSQPPIDISEMEKPESPPEPTPPTDVEPEVKPDSQPPNDMSETDKLDTQPATDVKPEEEPGLQLPNDTSEMDKRESPSATDIKPEEKPDSQPPSDTNGMDEPEPMPPTDVKPEEKPDSQLPDTSEMDKPEPMPATDVESGEKPNTQSPIDTSGIDKAEPTPATNVEQGEEPGLQPSTDASQMDVPTTSDMNVKDEQVSPKNESNIEKPMTQPCSSVLDQIEKYCNKTQEQTPNDSNQTNEPSTDKNQEDTNGSQTSTDSSLIDKSEPPPPADINQEEKPASQPPNQTDNSNIGSNEVDSHQGSDHDKSPSQSLDNEHAASPEGENHIDNSAGGEHNDVSPSEATPSEKGDIHTANIIKEIINPEHNTTPLTPPLSNSIDDTNEMKDDKSTSSEKDPTEEVDENAATLKLSSINVIISFFCIILVARGLH